MLVLLRHQAILSASICYTNHLMPKSCKSVFKIIGKLKFSNLISPILHLYLLYTNWLITYTLISLYPPLYIYIWAACTIKMYNIVDICNHQVISLYYFD